MITRFCFGIVFFTIATIFAQDSSLFCEQTQALKLLIEKEHVRPKPLDDSLSAGVYDQFLDQLDPNKRFFTTQDIAVFEKDKLQFDDYIRTGSCDFISIYSSTLTKRIEFAKRSLLLLQEQPLDYSGTDTLVFTPGDSFKYVATEARIAKYWNKKVRYGVLMRLIEEDSIFASIQRNFKEREALVKPVVIQREICILDELLHQNGGIERFVQEAFLNAYASYMDPNTLFFNDTEKSVFESTLSTNSMSFGFMTSKNDSGEIVIEYITPGSSAHRNEDFEEGDIIKSLKSGNDTMELVCVSNKDIQAFTQDEAHYTIEFRLKKQDGSMKTVTLSKAEIKVEENTVQGFILGSDTKIGYINVPSFYTDFESWDGLGLANDLAKELYKLEKENIAALIIDLRFNGGGSMKEATDLSGMFVDRGPLSIIKYKEGEISTLKDAKRGMLFTKPLLLLVNGFSASASEFFAGAMQDYNRAIIVGTPTYGKSSAQTILPLSNEKELGYCKITVDQFYRVTGKSLQSEGIIPDIQLPDMYDRLPNGEKHLKFALAIDSVPVTLKHRALTPFQLGQIKMRSAKRVTASTGFQNIRKFNELLVNSYINKDTTYSLTLENVYNDYTGSLNLWKKYADELEGYTASMVVSNTMVTNELLAYSSEEKKANTIILKEITSDLQIEEAYHILTEYLLAPNTH
ncbi:S41 family peptidase [Altibacter lentus]|uniref:S41 family peptidase n=1 Tax=Altibacter lentus TaxID=1223410 RepID=UPI000558988A|nr:S41 family peptidase [Altibacter lentus]